MKIILFAWGLLITLGMLNSCTQPGIIGSDLLKQDHLDVIFTDQVNFITYLQATDSLKTYGPNAGEQLLGFLCGQFSDPVFGLSTSVINAQLRLNTANPPDFDGATLDSMVFILPYRSERVAGDTTEAYNLGTYTCWTNRWTTHSGITPTGALPPADSSPPPRYSQRPTTAWRSWCTEATQWEPSCSFPRCGSGSTPGFAQSLFAEDSLVLETDSSFLLKYKGLQIKNHGQNKGMLCFNLNSTSAGLTVYYHVDTVFSQYTSLSPPAAPESASLPMIMQGLRWTFPGLHPLRQPAVHSGNVRTRNRGGDPRYQPDQKQGHQPGGVKLPSLPFRKTVAMCSIQDRTTHRLGDVGRRHAKRHPGRVHRARPPDLGHLFRRHGE